MTSSLVHQVYNESLFVEALICVAVIQESVKWLVSKMRSPGVGTETGMSGRGNLLNVMHET